MRVGARQERALDDRDVLEVLREPGARQLALDVREVAGAALEPQHHLGGIPERQEKLPLEALADVPPRERHRLSRELQAGRQLEAVEGPRRGGLAALEPCEPRAEPVELGPELDDLRDRWLAGWLAGGGGRLGGGFGVLGGGRGASEKADR